MNELRIRESAAISLMSRVAHHGSGKDYIDRLVVTYLDTLQHVQRNNVDFYAHLVAYNAIKGTVRDAKIAFPVIGLREAPEYALWSPRFNPGGMKEREIGVLTENSVAALLILSPKYLVRAIEFSSKLSNLGYGPMFGGGNKLEYGVTCYIRKREQHNRWWDATALRERRFLKKLYIHYHIKPSKRAQDILFDNKYPAGSVFEVVANLRSMPPNEAAGAIREYKIPMPVATGAVAQAKDPNLVIAMIDMATGNELKNMAASLQKSGAMANPAIKAAFTEAVERAKGDRRVTGASTTRAIRAADDSRDEDIDDTFVASQMRKLQESVVQREADATSPEGNWLILADKSGSMSRAIGIARKVASYLARTITNGTVSLVFFDSEPKYVDATGKSLEQLEQETALVYPGGFTSIGIGLRYIIDKGIEPDGIVIVSDMEENTFPYFVNELDKYHIVSGKTPNVYLAHVYASTLAVTKMHALIEEKVPVGVTDLDVSNVDDSGLQELLKMLRTSRFSLRDEIMGTPLLTIEGVFRKGA